jgi:uncharacterized protein YkwD
MFRFNLFLILLFVISCSTVSDDAGLQKESYKIYDYSHNEEEMTLINLINKHRIDKGLSALKVINHASYLGSKHNAYMINAKTVSHDLFMQRSDELTQLYGATYIGENVAYNYSSNKGALDAWLNSPSHKKNIEGDFTHFGLSVVKETTSGKNYITNLFIRKP